MQEMSRICYFKQNGEMKSDLNFLHRDIRLFHLGGWAETVAKIRF